jgi:ATP-dependent Clp protease ATP-binding subunit ClpA
VKRFIQKEIETELGRLLIKGSLSEGDTALVDSDGKSLFIGKSQ